VKYHAADARMSLGSALLKRAYIVKSTGIKWSEIRLGRKLDEKLGKPCWIPPSTKNSEQKWAHIDFNVSHQNGLVVLVGICVPQSPYAMGKQVNCVEGDVEMAVDLVSPAERAAHDLSSIFASDLSQFLSTFEHAFSEEELFNLANTLPAAGSVTLLSGQKIANGLLSSSYPRADRAIICGNLYKVPLKLPPESKNVEVVEILSDLIIEEKLRVFYTAFSLKEAYFKLRGEGITAEWIKDLEFNGLRAPAQGGVARCSLAGTWGEKILCDSRHSNQQTEDVEGLEITLHKKPVTDVLTELQAYEEGYVICTMLRTKPGSPAYVVMDFPTWVRVDMERDVLSIATRWNSLS
jgi:4'-phosphopantetheinyl transferase